MISRIVRLPALALAALLLALISLASLALAPSRLGRLVRTVSIPRMQEHRMRTVLTVLGLALAVGLLVSVVLVNRSILLGANSTIDQIAGKADLQVSAGSSGFDESLLELIRATPGVYRSTPAVQQMVAVHDPRAPGERLLVLGVDMLGEEDAYFRHYQSAQLDAIQRDPLAFLNADNHIIVAHKFAQRLGYKLHDNIQLLTSSGVKPFEIWGFLEDESVGRAFGGAVAIMYYAAMQVAFDRGHNIDRIDVAVAPGQDRASVARALQSRLGAGVSVEPPAQRSEQLGKLLAGVRSGLTFSSLVALFVGAFLIQNTMATSVVQRKREIATLRALGTTRGQILALLSLEGLLLGLVGSGLGILTGIVLSHSMLADTTRAVDETYVQLAVSHVHLDPQLVLGAFIAGVAAAVAASALPAWRAARTSPAESMRTGALMSVGSYPRVPARGDLLGVGLLIVSWLCLLLPVRGDLALNGFAALICQQLAAVFLLPRVVQTVQAIASAISARSAGLETRLASENLTRDIHRTSMTAGALMLCAAMTVTIGVFVTSLNRSVEDWIEYAIPGELFITSGTRMGSLSQKNAPLSDDFGAALATIPHVLNVKGARVVEMPFRGTSVKTVAFSSVAFEKRARFQILEGGASDEVFQSLRAGAVAVSENFSRRFDVHPGQRIPLSVKDGTREFTVSAVVVDYTSDIGTILIDRKIYIGAWNDSRVDTYQLDLDPSADARAVQHEIQRHYGARYDLFVLTNREYRAEISRLTSQMFSLLRALELVAIIVAVFGVVNAQATNVLDRVREIGVLRAVGMLRRQTRTMLVAEATLIGLTGIIAGILLGASGGQIFLDHINVVQTGWRLPYHFPFKSTLEATATLLAASALAGWYPGERAAQLPVTEALEYE